MSNADFTTNLLVDQSSEEVFNAITNVRGWWSEEITGSTDKLNEVFNYHYKDVHRCTVRIIELVPNKKVVWLVEDNYFNFTEDKTEWKGTRIAFEISKKGDQTQIVFSHIGLSPHYECYEICRESWGNYIHNSLRSLITSGKGQPNPKEGGFNEKMVEKWNLK